MGGLIPGLPDFIPFYIKWIILVVCIGILIATTMLGSYDFILFRWLSKFFGAFTQLATGMIAGMIVCSL